MSVEQQKAIVLSVAAAAAATAAAAAAAMSRVVDMVCDKALRTIRGSSLT